MADLNVQPKKRTPIWPWLLLALIIAAVIFFMVGNDDTDSATIDGRDTTESIKGYRSDTTP